DPRHLGAILRTACAAGVAGVVVPERRAAGITAAVEKVSAGASEHIAVARVTNLGQALEQLKEAGCWLVGLDERAQQSFTEVDFTNSVGLVVGGEGKGLREHVRAKCDFVVSIPTLGPIGSLNVSVACGVALYEAVRQRQAKVLRRR
ncbi:MAG: 23S rRNA (guanosine(2251)-2'-O)-methyltransferase RlmB, partial [Terriglobia bacterium]